MQKRCENMRVDFQREESASHCVDYYIDQYLAATRIVCTKRNACIVTSQCCEQYLH